MSAKGPVLEVADLVKHFPIRKGVFGRQVGAVRAVDGVSFAVGHGETLGVVGESGCGKSTLARAITMIEPPTAGELTISGQTVVGASAATLRALRPRVQMVFQNPYGSLNPRQKIGHALEEPLRVNTGLGASERTARARAMMAAVGLRPEHYDRYPHMFSGGQRQRIAIARALMVEPEVLVLDEPVSALDVSIQAQVLNLLKDLKKALGLTYVFVSHNLAVVDYMADRIAVMCAGRLVEVAPREALFKAPIHPYTQALLAAVPEPDIDRPLDLTALMEGRASIPSAWPAPFTIDDGADVGFIDLGQGHYVRAAIGTTPSTLRARARPRELA
jgi:peptide/nickel transport system ATP-binding protein